MASTGTPGTDPEHMWTVGEAARLAGVTVRTLHHWDELGLVQPAGRTWAGYRCYDAASLARIHRVVVYREMGMSLPQIADIVNKHGTALEHLQRQHDMLLEQAAQLRERTRQVERMIAMEKSGISLTPEEAQRIFGQHWKPEYQDEARQRWGDTPQWAESTARTAGWSAADWEQIKAETDALNQLLGAALRAGVSPDSAQAGELAEEHRASVEKFYPCTHAMQVVLAQMYTNDERFAASYEDVETGLAQWLRAAIEANARRHGVDPDTATWE